MRKLEERFKKEENKRRLSTSPSLILHFEHRHLKDKTVLFNSNNDLFHESNNDLINWSDNNSMFQFYCSKEKIKDRRDETPIMDETSWPAS